MKYVVEFKDGRTGAVSEIDHVETSPGLMYTAEQYIIDCEMFADDEWCNMLKGGEVSLVEVEA